MSRRSTVWQHGGWLYMCYDWRPMVSYDHLFTHCDSQVQWGTYTALSPAPWWEGVWRELPCYANGVIITFIRVVMISWYNSFFNNSVSIYSDRQEKDVVSASVVREWGLACPAHISCLNTARPVSVSVVTLGPPWDLPPSSPSSLPPSLPLPTARGQSRHARVRACAFHINLTETWGDVSDVCCLQNTETLFALNLSSCSHNILHKQLCRHYEEQDKN